MKILFISRSTLFKDKGGDTIQVQNTAEYLRKINVDVDIRLCDEHNIDYSQYHLIHFFNIIRPADILRHIERSKKPYVVSTIYVDYSEYEKRARGGPIGMLFKFVPGDAITKSFDPIKLFRTQSILSYLKKQLVARFGRLISSSVQDG